MPSSDIFAKLNLKDQADIVVLNAPESFEVELSRLRSIEVRRNLVGSRRVAFSLAFVTRQAEVDAAAKSLVTLAEGDAVIWFAYPKGTSKRYKCEFNRDTGWRALGAAGFEGVRMVAIDEDWSAFRFRRVEFIRSLTRSSRRAVSQAAKARPGRKRGTARTKPRS